jgi:hypothetical protein
MAARYPAKAGGSDLTSWIMAPAQAEALNKLKVASGSNQALIQFVEDGITVAGLPVIVSDQVDADTKFWGIPRRTLSWSCGRAPRSRSSPTSRRTVCGSALCRA